tara:strand:+ start:12452 stop:13363 length:912 start_codon:yes stop_codon:yes gene_type:complete
MLKNFIKNSLNNFLSKFNFELVNIKNNGPFNFTDRNINPIAAQYLFEHRKAIVNIDLSTGRTSRCFDLQVESLDPPLFSIRKALNKNLKGEELYLNILTSLKENHSLTIFNKAIDVLDIDPNNCNNLINYPWWAQVNPWDMVTFEDKLKYYPSAVKRDRLKNGMKIKSTKPDEIMKEDLNHSLPSHAKQYSDLVEKIRLNGFKSGSVYGYINAEIFSIGNDYVWKPGGEGNHRLVAAAALGIKKLPVLITKIIRFEDLRYWPNVERGFFTHDQAAKLFHNVFNAKPSRIYNEWIKRKHIDKKV